MNFLELAQSRRSIRSYLAKPVEKEKILQVLEAGRIAPSACNLQPWIFIVLEGQEQIASTFSFDPREWFKKAPCVIVVCYSKEKCWQRDDGREYGTVDATIAMDHIILAATELKLGTCWMGAFDEKKICKALNLPKYIIPVAMTPLGYFDSHPKMPERRLLDEVVYWGNY